MNPINGRLIFTIGHSDHGIEQFIELLARNQIEAVADVRSVPQSKFTPQFSRDTVSGSLAAAGIQYVFLGEELGARRSEPECFEDGKATYGLIAETSSFRSGLSRLHSGSSQFRVAIMCAERDPLVCHRAILVCRHLRSPDLSICHILHDGTIEPHDALEERLLKAAGLGGRALLNTREQLVEDAYEIQGDKIAYVRQRELADERT